MGNLQGQSDENCCKKSLSTRRRKTIHENVALVLAD